MLLSSSQHPNMIIFRIWVVPMITSVWAWYTIGVRITNDPCKRGPIEVHSNTSRKYTRYGYRHRQMV